MKCHEVPITRTIEDYVLCLLKFAKNSTGRIEHEWTLQDTVYPCIYLHVFSVREIDGGLSVQMYTSMQLCWVKIRLRRQQPAKHLYHCVCVDSSAMQLVSKLPLPCSGCPCLNVLGPLKIRPHQSAAPLMQGFTVSQWAACTGLSLASACPGSILFAKLGLTLKTYQNYWIFGETRNDVVEIKGHRRTYAPDSDVVHATGALQAHCAQIQPSKQVCDTGRLVSLLTATQCPMRISRLCTWHMIEDGHSAVMPSCCRLCPEACFYLHGNHIIWYQNTF